MVAASKIETRYVQLSAGDPAPDFIQRCSSNERFHFDTAAGRYIVLCFFASAGNQQAQKALSILSSHRKLFDDERISFFAVSLDPEDEKQKRVKESLPGIRVFWDADGLIARKYGALPIEKTQDQEPVRRQWVILDPSLRVVKIFPFSGDDQGAAEVAAFLKALPPVNEYAGTELHAPVLILPRMFEPEFCRHLISLYEQHGGEESGFMRQEGEKTVMKHDHNHKKRKDFTFGDQPEFESLRADIQKRIMRRVVPEVKKFTAFEITRMERYIVACYDGGEGGFFRAHRDNTTKGTAHRRFACTINLNTDEFEGGELRFPEFGNRTYRAPTGGAVVFSCSLLHEATPVTKGKRYAFLPFFYDEAAKKIREENLKYLAQS